MTFWDLIRYRLASLFIRAGLHVMPSGRYKTELLDSLWRLYAKVMAETHPHT